MALFTEKFVQETIAHIAEWQQTLASALGYTPLAGAIAVTNPSPLHQKLSLLVSVANGELTHSKTTKATVQEVEEALQEVLSLLLGNPLHSKPQPPPDFWQTEVGVLVSRVRWWLSVDDLITISNAAALAFGENSQANRMKIVRAIDNGLLDWVPDPSIANPQQNRRVLRPQVERLRDQRRLPA